MRGAATCADGHAKRSLGTARQLALGRFAIHEKATGGTQPVGRAGAVRSLLFTDNEQKVDALLSGIRELVGGHHHRGGDPFRVARAPTAQTISIEAWPDERRYGVEM